jgi:hypothetical protein
MATVTPGIVWTSGETVTPAKLNSAASPTVAVADGEITTAKIADGAVVNDKLSLAANAGEIKKAINADNDPPIYACRAWVNFDGTKDTTGAVSTANTNRQIRASGNVASVFRIGPGFYTVTFTAAMPDANYAVTAMGSATSDTNGGFLRISTISSQSVVVACQKPSTSSNPLFDDPTNACLAIFR